MANGEKTAQRQKPESLLNRLQHHIDTLDQIYASRDTAGLLETIEEMRKDVEDLEYMAPHVYVLPRPR